MLGMLQNRFIHVVAAPFLFWAVLSIAPSGVAAENVLQSEDIEKLLNIDSGRKKGISYQPTESDSTTPLSQRVALPAIQFEFDSDQLRGSALVQVKELVEALGSDSLRSFAFAVQGHTDSVGDNAYNRNLSLRRARTVKRHLVAGDISQHRLVEVGFGEDFPIAEIAGEDERNRRVEIVNLGSIELADSTVSFVEAGRRALLIGIDEYQHVSRLNGTVNDAQAMKSFITENVGYHDGDIMMLLDSEATRDNILTSVEKWLIDGTKDGDEVFLYFSGHGYQQLDVNGDETDNLDETLVPVDAVVTEDGTIKGMINDDEMADLLQRLSGRRVNVVIDACHSGTGTKLAVVGNDWRYVKTPRHSDGRPIRVVATGRTRGVADSYTESFLSDKSPGISDVDISVWTAVKAEQKALVDEEAVGESGSVFTRRLLWGARDGKADVDRDGAVTQSELYEYVVRESEIYCTKYAHRCPQGLTPQFFGDSSWKEEVAFANTSEPSPSSRTVTTKDILVRQAEQLATGGGDGVQIRIDSMAPVKTDQLEFPVDSVIEIVVESAYDGHLVLLDINAAGEMVQIFPNELSLQSGVSNSISAGQSVRLPGADAGFHFQVEPPVGSGMLIAVVSQESTQLANLVSQYKDLSVVPRPNAYLVEMGEALRTGGDDSRWHSATLGYETIKAPQ